MNKYDKEDCGDNIFKGCLGYLIWILGWIMLLITAIIIINLVKEWNL